MFFVSAPSMGSLLRVQASQIESVCSITPAIVQWNNQLNLAMTLCSTGQISLSAAPPDGKGLRAFDLARPHVQRPDGVSRKYNFTDFGRERENGITCSQARRQSAAMGGHLHATGPLKIGANVPLQMHKPRSISPIQQKTPLRNQSAIVSARGATP